MSEQEKAEQQKKELFYDPIPDGEYDENGQPLMDEEEPCEYGFSEDCVEPSLRNTNCCFECWLYTEVDKETQKQAKEEKCPDNCEDCSLLEVEEDAHGLRYPICHKKEVEKK
jgi:hypothetical protein